MLEKLTKDPKKVPAPDRGKMMSLLVKSEKAVELDANAAFKSVWVTNCLDGSEDYLVNDKIFALVIDSMRQFRNEMTAKPPPKAIKEVIGSLIPPKCIKRGKNTDGKFLDSIKKVFHEHETSVQFTAAQNQLENAYKSARTSLKKQIRNKKKQNEAFFISFYICFYYVPC